MPKKSHPSHKQPQMIKKLQGKSHIFYAWPSHADPVVDSGKQFYSFFCYVLYHSLSILLERDTWILVMRF